MTSLLATLNDELGLLDRAGSESLDSLLVESSSVLLELHEMEAELEKQVANEQNRETSTHESNAAPLDFAASLEGRTHAWYKASIDGLKSYNSQISKFSKNVLSSTAFSVDLDDAYSFPLLLDSFPASGRNTGRNMASTMGHAVESGAESGTGNSRSSSPISPDRHPGAAASSKNRQHLMRSIVLHLLKSGHGSLVTHFLEDFGVAGEIEPETLANFVELSGIVEAIRTKHNISGALSWFNSRTPQDAVHHENASFKFHMLQFVLLLSGRSDGDSASQNTDATDAEDVNPDAVAAYKYAKANFPNFMKEHMDDIGSVLSLLLCRFPRVAAVDPKMQSLKKHILQEFVHSCETKKRHSRETRFIAEILANFDTLHAQNGFFDSLAAEFVREYCKGSALSTESSLFQAILAGHVNLPNFYKYSQLQKKLRRRGKAPVVEDLPFSLSSKNQFLFNFHPIFICPISKEQLVPLVSVVKIGDTEVRDRKRKQIFVSPNEVLVSSTNPVVVFEHCRHLALKESVRHLTKGGAEMFKCHYCYKKHKLSDVSDAYFIDL